MKVQAHYQDSATWEEFEADTLEDLKAQIARELADPQNFKYFELDENDQQTGPSVSFEELYVVNRRYR